MKKYVLKNRFWTYNIFSLISLVKYQPDPYFPCWIHICRKTRLSDVQPKISTKLEKFGHNMMKYVLNNRF